MRAAAITAEASATIHGPEPTSLEGRPGSRYWVQSPYRFTGNAEVDRRLSGFPVFLFHPGGRPPGQTPVVVGLQGMAAPLGWNSFLVPTLLDMGISCVLFDTPLAGERSMVRNYQGDIVSEILPLVTRGIRVSVELVAHAIEAVSRDLRTVLRIAEERHGLAGPRALFGVSLGVLLTSFAFLRDGTGHRLLGAIGHADLPRFARGRIPVDKRWLAALPGRVIGQLGGWWYGQGVAAGLQFLRVLHILARGRGPVAASNPMTYVDRAGKGRPVRFLAGADDPIARPEDAAVCAARFPDGKCYVVPGLVHGGDDFVGHARTFVATQLADWGW